ncbi:MAG: DUF1844 domain-containing protein [Candidatus Omnitrophica bacterium]|nr:DUF1844 domain-containing protein [Candidatus Omnitrophota bacterium]MCM8808875.1 DUF1844 domain-containing protein [Candidatus Omnitrophota bacterium]MCM8811000.1 DUF1844 domain-containing protein [Candidatus Omnitrophota bacterium]MCM8832906.1 DUF1844 domain-containing protein [Candidatus Omnitrophota bacterium]
MKFNIIVSFFAEIGWQALGKISNPITGKIEKNLEMAKQIIELLDVLKEKTNGNLSKEEEKFLESTISDLKLNYVEELSKEKQGNESKDKI